MNKDKKIRLAELICDEKMFNPKGIWGTPKRLLFYLDFLFKDVDLRNKSVMDIGAGIGQFSIYMALSGAKNVLSLEPELDGGYDTMTKKFRGLMKELVVDNIEIEKKTFQDYEDKGRKFDMIFLHNSINHLNEPACETLLTDQNSYDIYLEYYKRLHDMNTDDGQLFIADCSNRNFFGDLKITNPISPTIEWNKHLGPKQWSELATKAGYKASQVNWTTPSHLGNVGQIFLANKVASYFTLSHFNVCYSK